jgi:hypothetical protein
MQENIVFGSSFDEERYHRGIVYTYAGMIAWT